jgi:phosphohistidine phosphatase
MKTLHVLRHAKSSWAEPGLDDHDRPLASRGRRDTKRLASYMQEAGIRPEIVLCSTARRAQETLAGVRSALGDGAVRSDRELYGASGSELVLLLRRLPAGIGSAMVVGHNPGLEELVALLASAGEDDAVRQLRTKFPTGALAALELDIPEWCDLAPEDGYLRSLVIPALLPDG